MEKIVQVLFRREAIFVITDCGNLYWRHLEDYPLLLKADDTVRRSFKISPNGDTISWDDIDFSMRITQFLDDKPTPGELAQIFRKFPMVDPGELATFMGWEDPGMIYDLLIGVKQPTPQQTAAIKEALHRIGRSLSNI